jgi:hypothetical protein
MRHALIAGIAQLQSKIQPGSLALSYCSQDSKRPWLVREGRSVEVLINPAHRLE